MDTLSINTFKSINTSEPGAARPQKKKGLIQDNYFAHAVDYSTPADYLNAVIEKQLKRNDKYSFGAQIFRQVRKEYNNNLKNDI